MSQKAKSFIKRFFPERVEKQTALEYITTAGFFADQIAALSELVATEGDLVESFAKFCQTFIPFMNARKDDHMKKLLTCWLENYEMYQANLSVVAEYEARIEAGDNHTLKEQKGEMQSTIDLMKQMLQTDGMILYSQTFEKLPYRTIVLDKPYILQSGGYRGPPAKQDTLFKSEPQ